MSSTRSSAAFLCLLFCWTSLLSCASQSRPRPSEPEVSMEMDSSPPAVAASEPAIPEQKAKPKDDNYEPLKLRPDPEEVPAALATIETEIDRPSVILAELIEIDVSRNYEWDVSLSGDDVTPQILMPDGGTECLARGRPVAVFRNLELRAFDRIVFKKSGFGVVPYIRIRAAGRVVHAAKAEDGTITPLGRGSQLRIDGASVRYEK